MKDIYIVLTHTGTILSNIIKLVKHTKYNHASISLDKELNLLYSFGRLNPYLTLPGGFIKEGIRIGTFKRFKNTKCKILKLEVTEMQYKLMLDKINYIVEHKKEYGFNIIGFLLAGINVRRCCSNKYYCSEFVKYILDFGKVDVSKIPDIVQPEDLLLIDGLEVVFEGLLREYI